MPFQFSKPNTNNNHSRTNLRGIPGRFSSVPLRRSKTLPTKSRLREGSVTDFGLLTKPTRCNLPWMIFQYLAHGVLCVKRCAELGYTWLGAPLDAQNAVCQVLKYHPRK